MRRLFEFRIAMTVFSALLLSPVMGAAQPLLPHTLHIDADKGISISYPDRWSVAQPTANTCAILNVPADQHAAVEPAVRVQIGYGRRNEQADAGTPLARLA